MGFQGRRAAAAHHPTLQQCSPTSHRQSEWGARQNRVQSAAPDCHTCWHLPHRSISATACGVRLAASATPAHVHAGCKPGCERSSRRWRKAAPCLSSRAAAGQAVQSSWQLATVQPCSSWRLAAVARAGAGSSSKAGQRTGSRARCWTCCGTVGRGGAMGGWLRWLVSKDERALVCWQSCFGLA